MAALWGLCLSAQTPPQWWLDHAVTNTNARFDQGLVSVGQAKYLIQQAYLYLEKELSQFGGAGDALDALYTSYCLNPPQQPEDDLRILTLGQLKYLAKPFYDRLLEVQFDTSAINPADGNYPWSIDRADDADKAPATIGQLKFVFSFDLSRSVNDNDQIPDWWEAQFNLDPQQTMDNSATDFDGDSILDSAEYKAKTDPTDYYNGELPQLRIVSGDGQTVPAGQSSEPLILRVENAATEGLGNAPLSIVLVETTAGTLHQATVAPATTISLRTEADGNAQVTFNAATDYSGLVTLDVIAHAGINTVSIQAALLVIEDLLNWGLFTGPTQSFVIDGTRIHSTGGNWSGQIAEQTNAVVNVFGRYVDLGAAIKKIVVGSDHVVALTDTGEVFVWGDNFFGQLGLSSFDATTIPAQINLPGAVLDIAAGDGFSGFLVDDGSDLPTIWLAGDLRGGLKAGAQLEASPVALEMSLFGSAELVELVASGRRILARDASGAVWGWGDNRLGQTDPGQAAFSVASPVQVVPANATRIIASPDASLALMDDARLVGWGNNRFGQLGASRVESSSAVEVATDVRYAAAGNGFIAYTTISNQLYTAGLNHQSQLGRDTGSAKTALAAPVVLPSNDALIGLAAGDRHLIYLTDSNSNPLYGFGDNRSGVLGEGATSTLSSPTLLSHNF